MIRCLTYDPMHVYEYLIALGKVTPTFKIDALLFCVKRLPVTQMEPKTTFDWWWCLKIIFDIFRHTRKQINHEMCPALLGFTDGCKHFGGHQTVLF